MIPAGDQSAAPEPSTTPVASSSPAPVESVLPSLASGFRVHDFTLVDLPLAQRAYSDQPIAPIALDYLADPNGVPITVRNGKHYLHPVAAAQQGIRQLVSYVAMNDATYLKRAEATALALVKSGVRTSGALWIPYHFDFALHGKPSDMMHAPWYSGMAQGQLLTLLCRLYEITGKARYLAAAKAIFASFTVVGRRAAPWVSWVERRYLWLEEYPGSPPDHTLNGFIFALYGIYDYYLTTQDPNARQVFRAGLTTVKFYLPRFRNPGSISHYCLTHLALSAKYHDIHIGQLRELAKMTGDAYFAGMADLFQSDYR